MSRVMKTGLLALTLLGTPAQAVSLKLRPQGDALTRAVQVALSSISTKDLPVTLDTSSGPTLTLGGVGVSAVPFNPDVIARVVLVGGEQRIEVNPNGPVPLQEAVQTELARQFKLSAWTAEAATVGFGGADLNRDGKIDLTDLALLMSNYGVVKPLNTSLVGDLNGDGKVNDVDVKLFSAQYKP